MELRKYTPGHHDACLAVFDSNTPAFFHPVEREGFETFLAQPDCPYFVMEHEDTIVGCGGYQIAPEHKLASLVWGMVRYDMQKQGLGRYLLLFRLREIAKAGGIGMVTLDTSQHAQPFFLKQGFKTANVAPNGYAPGLDRVEMIMKLEVCP